MARIQVVDATVAAQRTVDLVVPDGTSLQEAVRMSRLIDGDNMQMPRLGVYGKLKAAESPVRDGDRIEIYRPLRADPKAARRKRAGGPNAVRGRTTSNLA